MRITRDYGLTSSKLEHDLLARLEIASIGQEEEQF